MFGAWLAIVIVLVAILAVLVYKKMLIERFILRSMMINLEARECFIRLRFQTEV